MPGAAMRVDGGVVNQIVLLDKITIVIYTGRLSRGDRPYPWGSVFRRHTTLSAGNTGNAGKSILCQQCRQLTSS